MVKKSIVIGVASILILISFLTCPTELISSAANGLIICSKVIIPSLFPFTAITLFLFNSGILNLLGKIISPATKKLTGLSGKLFSVVLMSFIGGFPVGAKLINQLSAEKAISQKTANRMLSYSVNPGPAFVIIGIGKAMFNRIDIGIIIYSSNILASLILCIICSFKEKKETNKISDQIEQIQSVSDIFVNSVADASASIISICGFVILFSAVIGNLNSYTAKINLAPLIALLEVSNGTIIYSDNIYFLSFLTAFSGFCVHAQILSVCKNVKIKYHYFLLARAISGILSLCATYLLIKIFKPTIETVSLSSDYIFSLGSNTIVLSAALIFMSLTLLVSIKQKYVEKQR